MWHTLRRRGVSVRGPLAADVVPLVTDKELAENMRRNLDFLRRQMPLYVTMGTEETVFGVLSLCRILYTLRTGEIVGKVAAAYWALNELASRWQPLIERAVKRYETNDLSGRELPLEGAEAFAAYACTAA